MSKLEFVNKVFVQWFFVRLSRTQSSTIYDYRLDSVSIMPDGNYGFAGRPKDVVKEKWWSLMGFIVPLTGWSSDYKYLGKGWMIRISKKKMTRKV